MQSLRFETKLMNSVQSKMDFFQEEMNMSYVEVQFFKTVSMRTSISPEILE
jgi:hypothetical protein